MTDFLLPLTFDPLPLGSIRPSGWLACQLRLQADGLSGHLDEFWPDVADSAWIGGQAEGWERGPYWLDGIVPLAFLLDDAALAAALKAKVERWVDYIVTHQHADGWLGPVQDQAYGDRYQAYDPWPVFVALKALTQVQEAGGDPRIVPAMQSFLRRLDGLLDEQPLFVWGKSRWADLVVSIHWLYERTGEGWLLELAAKAQRQGYDWRHHFENFRYFDKTPGDGWDQTTHVVNNAMAVKASGVWYRQSHDPGDRAAVFRVLEMLDTYHGQVTGMFSGDEHLAGRSPSQGTELCAVVEMMFSLEVLIAILGEPALADRLERIAFNALPATFSPDMWAHQYDQQVNQVVCKVAEDRVYVNNRADANIFGLEPNYGCCTANMHQGWPKFAASTWMKSRDGGLAAVAYAPSTVQTEVAGATVRIELATDYPFDEELLFTVHADRACAFPLYLRIPAWASQATITVSGAAPVAGKPGDFHRIERTWSDGDRVHLRLPMPVAAERRFQGALSITRGPLVYALPMGEDWRLIGGEPPHGDWEVYPTTPWNYALQVDPDHPESSVSFEARGLGEQPFSPEGAPVVAHVQGRRLPGWDLQHNAAAPPPPSPIHSTESLEMLDLIPYGCTNLRVAEFPLLA